MVPNAISKAFAFFLWRGSLHFGQEKISPLKDITSDFGTITLEYPHFLHTFLNGIGRIINFLFCFVSC
ncbi:hypothetical protein A0Z39_06210 [Campylobacter lari]|nr:hypothetical protein [Campylobacter lari]EAK0847603.1 hypothetical protein [Campylobacter lari]EAK0980125.1 hypothetical protein [Campylobacter lari]MCR6542596.1 hypothetical protein [Campylobacter lari]